MHASLLQALTARISASCMGLHCEPNALHVVPHALQALIDRILLDGEVSKMALEDARLGGFREDDWLKPVLGA